VHRFSIGRLKLRPLIWPGASHTPPETQQKRASTTPCQLRLPWPTRLVRSRKTAQQSRSRIAIPGPAPLKHLGWVKLLHQHGTAHLQITGGWATPGLRCRDSWSISRWDGLVWDGVTPINAAGSLEQFVHLTVRLTRWDGPPSLRSASMLHPVWCSGTASGILCQSLPLSATLLPHATPEWHCRDIC
jgi:hypothetical protein